MLEYRIVTQENKKFVFLLESGMKLDDCDVWAWLVDKRDEDPELYAEIVQMYFKLKKNYTKEEE